MRMGARGGIWQVEYRSNYLAFLRMKARVGIEIDVVDNDASGEPRGSESTNSTLSGHWITRLAAWWRVEKLDETGPPSAADGKFELIKDVCQRFEPRQPWLPVRDDQVAQQPNQRPAVVLGQVKGAFCL